MGKKSKKDAEAPGKETFQPLPVECKNPATVVLLLKSPEEDILVKACEAIYAYAEKGDENRVSLLQSGALDPLCRLITHSNKLVRRNAFMALGIMTTNGDVKSSLKKLNVIPTIIEKLSLEEDTVVHEFATLCLNSLSVDVVCKIQIFDNNGLPTLMQLLSSPDPDVKKNSLEIIFNLIQDYKSRQVVHTLGGIPPLLELLKSDFPVIQHLALKILECVTTDRDTRNTFRKEQGFEKLMDVLNNVGFRDLHVGTLKVVANCLSDSESVQLIQKAGGLTKLMEFLLAPNMPEIQSAAVKCLSRVAQNSMSRKLLHDQEIEKILVEFLSEADVSMNTSTCHAVAAMSLHLASKESFRELGGIPAVVQLLKSESLVVKEAATQALYSLTHSSQLNALAVYEAGGHEVLVQLLHESCLKTIANSAATLCNMAGQEIIRSSLLSHGVIQALVEPLKCKDTDVLVHAALCVALLACDIEARTELQKAGGLEPLASLLHSNYKEVLQNACFAVNVCASDGSTAVEMCKFGALEKLQEINQSVNRRNRFSESAMKTLVNANLSVKYSLMGHLASTDILTTGFYDAGKARSGQRILTLEELSKQPVNQDQPIILVNTEIETKKEERDEAQFDAPKEKDQDPQVWHMIEDVSLQMLVDKAKRSILRMNDEQEQFSALARLVSEAMGGAVVMEKLHEFPWMLHLSELKVQLQSNIVPIGLIDKGIYCHRALLFKCLADCIGLSCTLVRGEYKRAWNELLLFSENPSSNRGSSQPQRYIVDLMHQPGSLLPVNTLSALKYQTI
ncbi:armadillo repeat-containing protein 3-like [Cololabis saira]|uniref:armadillo repeat-containing protein 3-like n=1 Tax=Cololabis saira TaxID=129043 RepID=UPI002AD3D880|nr:armadillo repeat-containing protein 3-like [Cololabis saira]